MPHNKDGFMVYVKLIRDGDHREDIEKVLEIVPEIFWTMPSSSTGKYHPQDEFAEGGLLLHTKRVIHVLTELEEAYPWVEGHDVLLGAAILHDVCNRGMDGTETWNVSRHDILVRAMVQQAEMSSPYLEEVCDLIEQHMGRWSSTPYKPEVEPGTLLHLADYLASRRNIKVEV